MKRFIKITAALTVAFCALAISCNRSSELSDAELEEQAAGADSALLARTQSKPWRGNGFVDGAVGGTWNGSTLNEPKTFNYYLAERDNPSSTLLETTVDYLFEYDPYLREWRPQTAYYEIEVDEANDRLVLHCTLREGLYWTYYDSDERIPVTSDDYVWWYNEISGDPEFQSSAYPQQFMTLPNGEEGHIDAVKIDDRRFDFIFPRITAEPLLSVNMNSRPAFIYRPAKEQGGKAAIDALSNISTDPRRLPSMGRWYITEYSPSQRIVYSRNPNYWMKDSNDVSVPYIEEQVVQIIGDENTEYLLFREGRTEAYQPIPENLAELVNNQGDNYTVFNAEGSLSAGFLSFNQNPIHADQPWYRWFTQKEFRQAISCLFNRDRAIAQTYRGLADPLYYFFPPANPYYNPDITLRYRYDPAEAVRLLESIGFEQRDGVMYDDQGIPVEFDVSVPSQNTVWNDTVLIIADECAAVGITVNPRQIDFQTIVESLTSTYDWQAVVIAFSAPLFPTQGSNVWPSNGNLHLWHPLQETPATEWEARVDYLYNEGAYTIDRDEAAKIWNEYQEILLEQCPVIYFVRQRSFYALRNRWDFSNMYYDNLNGAETTHIFLRQN